MQGSSYAPLQFLRSPWNRDVYTAIDNQIDGRTTLVLYLGAASSLPSELQKYNLGCILIHKDEKQIYLNTGNDTTPTWEAFGPGTSVLPTPFVPGQYLTNDGVDAFWSLIDLATGVTGLLDSDHIDLSDLANNSDFIDYLIGNSYFTSSLANDSNFLTDLITNLNTSGLLTVSTDGVTITGDGTPGNPLVAVGSTPTAVLDVQLNGVSVEDPVDTINFIAPAGTVTSPSAGVVDVDLNSLIPPNITNGTQLWLGSGVTDNPVYNNVMLFGDYIISAYKAGSGSLTSYTQKKTSAGGYETVSNFAYWENTGTVYRGIAKSSDGTKIYMMTVNGNSGLPWTFTLTEYDTTGTLLNTSSYTTPSGYIVAPECMGLFVYGNKVVVSVQYEPTITGSGFWTEFTISGSSLTTPTLTNLAVGGTTGIYSTLYDGTDVYIGYGVGGSLTPLSSGVTKYTYSSPNFTSVASFTLPQVPVTVYSPQQPFFNGFEIDGTNIGLYKNITTFDVDDGSYLNTVLKAKYDLYPF